MREGLIDADYIEAHTEGFASVRAMVSTYWPERVERITGVSEANLIQAACMLGEARTAIVLTARGAEQQAQGVNNTLSFINIALALGLVGKPNSGYGCLTGQGNGQGGREHGQKADQLPGYRKIDDPTAREHVASVWGIDPDTLPAPGKSAYELLDSLGQEGGVRSLLVLGSNVVVSAPNAVHVEREAAVTGLSGGVGLLPLRDGGTGGCGSAVGAVGGGRWHDDESRRSRDYAEAGFRAAA